MEVTGLLFCNRQRTPSVQYTTGTILATVPQAYIQFCLWLEAVHSSWNVMAHSDAQEGKWRGNRRME